MINSSNVTTVLAIIGLGLVLALAVALYPFLIAAAVIIGVLMLFKNNKKEA